MSSLNKEISKEEPEINTKKVKKDHLKLKMKIAYFIILGIISSSIFGMLADMIYNVTHNKMIFTTNAGMYPTINEKVKDSEGIYYDGIERKVFSSGDTINFCTYDPEVTVFELKRFDVVVAEKDIYRLIGFPGENINYSSGSLFINGSLINEDFLSDEMKSYTIDCSVTLGEDRYFLAYDNRSMVSGDSLHKKYFTGSDFLGKVTRVSGVGVLDGTMLIKRHYTFPKFL